MSPRLERGGDRRTFLESRFSQGRGKRLPWHIPRGAGAGAQEKQQGQGRALGSNHGLDVLRVSVPSTCRLLSQG